jgi:UDP-N-acetylglucosamine 3-dehydrogenase
MSRNIGVVGLGFWGRNHVRNLNEMGRLAGICDASVEAVVNANMINGGLAGHGVTGYTSPDVLAARDDLAGVVIATPPATHYPLAKAFLKRGIAVLIEKPMAATRRECYALARMSSRHKIAVGHLERFNPVMTYAKSAVTSGVHGKLLRAEFHREGPDSRRLADGIVMDSVIHDLDLAAWLCGEPVKLVSVVNPDRTMADIVILHKESVSCISGGWRSREKRRNFRLFFENATVSGDFTTQEIRVDSKDGSFLPRIQKAEPLRAELENFCAMVDGKAQPAVSALDGAAATLMALDCSKSE